MKQSATLLILFGLPGTGKTFAGQLLAREFGFHFYDADDAMTPDIRRRLTDVTSEADAEAARDEWYAIIVDQLARRLHTQRRVAFAQALVQQKHRHLLQMHFPRATFVLMTAPADVITARLAERAHFLPPGRAADLRALFEPVDLPYHRIVNAHDDPAQLRRQLADLLAHLPAADQ